MGATSEILEPFIVCDRPEKFPRVGVLYRFLQTFDIVSIRERPGRRTQKAMKLYFYYFLIF